MTHGKSIPTYDNVSARGSLGVPCVALIRRSPPGPPLPNGQPSGTNVNCLLQISSIRRIDNKIEVMLNRDDDQGESVTLESRDGEFVIVRHGHWIA